VGGWATQQLAEFLSVVSLCPDQQAAIDQAVELAAAACDAEVAAIVRGGRVLASVGFAEGKAPDEIIVSAAANIGNITVPGAQASRSIVVAIDGPASGQLLLARAGEEEFSGEEVQLLRAMARSLGLTLRLLAVVATERRLRKRSESQVRRNKQLLNEVRERQRLLEWISRIERLISGRKPLQDVLQAICAGAADLLAEDLVLIRTRDALNPGYALSPRHLGITEGQLAALLEIPFTGGISGEAMREDRLVVRENIGEASTALGGVLGELRIQAAMAAPIRESGEVIGTLTVASRRRGRRFAIHDQEMLLAMAEHASLAFTDARTLAALEHKAFYDDLTGLANRALFLDRLDRSLARSQRKLDARVAVLFIDLDRFKNVNDSLGHAYGDMVLAVVGQRVAKCLRAVDTAARLGGDEFAVIIEDPVDALDAAAVADRILELLRDPIEVAGRELHITGSAGVAVSSGEGESGGELVRNADLALNRAKAEGARSSVRYSPQMHADVVRRLELEANLTHGLENDEFRAYYQPMVDLSTGRIVGVEALVRWIHPIHGVVPPADFLDVAEETGIIIPIGRSVFRQATRQVKEWSSRLVAASELELSVNLSGTQAQDPGLLQDVAQVLSEVDLPADRLVFEITETVLMRDAATAADRLNGLKVLGAQVAIDDFGTGYSSLAYLSQFPIDILKIDRSFVQGITSRHQDLELVEAIIVLARSLRLGTVAEGIESDEQRHLLASLGCHRGQGYHFARPLAPNDFETLLLDSLTATERGLEAGEPSSS